MVEAPGGFAQQHLVPRHDLQEHRLCEHCPCAPVEDAEAPDYLHHNAFDQRESYEAGREFH